VVGLAGDVAFDASNGFAFGQAVCLAALDVGLRFRAVTQPDQGGQPGPPTEPGYAGCLPPARTRTDFESADERTARRGHG
jgi:hypothetical protein